MHLLYKSASLLTYTYYYRQSYSRADYEDSYALALSAALSGGHPADYRVQLLHRESSPPPPLSSLRGSMDLSSMPALGIKTLRLHGLHHHAAVSATYRVLRLFLPDVVLEVMSFWQGGHWNIREWREALHHARGHFPPDVLEPRDFPIIAQYPTLREFSGMPRWGLASAGWNRSATGAQL